MSRTLFLSVSYHQLAIVSIVMYFIIFCLQPRLLFHIVAGIKIPFTQSTKTKNPPPPSMPFHLGFIHFSSITFFYSYNFAWIKNPSLNLFFNNISTSKILWELTYKLWCMNWHITWYGPIINKMKILQKTLFILYKIIIFNQLKICPFVLTPLFRTKLLMQTF